MFQLKANISSSARLARVQKRLSWIIKCLLSRNPNKSWGATCKCLPAYLISPPDLFHMWWDLNWFNCLNTRFSFFPLRLVFIALSPAVFIWCWDGFKVKTMKATSSSLGGSKIRSLKQYADINHPLWFLLPLYSQILASETISRGSNIIRSFLSRDNGAENKKQQIRAAPHSEIVFYHH